MSTEKRESVLQEQNFRFGATNSVDKKVGPFQTRPDLCSIGVYSPLEMHKPLNMNKDVSVPFQNLGVKQNAI